ncbi:membrane-associated tyrosine- and threonine-specific cdc2-inhibitory kinase-like isoform X1 [Dysidea avara]|uniref:membrane-associated tyrosine- and threonine-specific cdc2-inhibitory kinase-like isoform X1 n=1 Tax=Dysidea avara TaxID=196820 RepID=UPI003321CC39
MAPELMQGRFGKPADIFNLGISLLEMACDMKLPNGGNAWHQLRSGYLPDEFTSHLSTELLDILKWMMHPQPQSRPTADQLLAYSSLIRYHQGRAIIIFITRQQPSCHTGVAQCGVD